MVVEILMAGIHKSRRVTSFPSCISGFPEAFSVSYAADQPTRVQELHPIRTRNPTTSWTILIASCALVRNFDTSIGLA